MSIEPIDGSDDLITAADRIDALRRGHVQWGCRGRHHGDGSPGCPRELHHHHDLLCEAPSRDECAQAGVAYRAPWEWQAR